MLLAQRILNGPPLLLDAAMGTELERRGVGSGLPLWSARALLHAPAAVLAIHAENVAAGAEILTANTFRTHRRSLQKEGLGQRSKELTREAVFLAREAAGGAPRPVFVVGGLSPLEDCYRPDLAPPDADLDREHAVQAGSLRDAGVDGILVETQNSVRELLAAVRAARATGLPVIACVATDGAGRLLSGEPIEEAGRGLAPLEPEAAGINCVPADLLLADLNRLAASLPGRPLAAYGNLGAPTDAPGSFSRELSPAEYARIASGWLAAGARIVGGCCGTTASHTAALRTLLDGQATNIASP